VLEGLGEGSFLAGCLGVCCAGSPYARPGLPPSLLVVGQESALEQLKALLYINRHLVLAFSFFCQTAYGGSGG
jgi:hypothetical protein